MAKTKKKTNSGFFKNIMQKCGGILLILLPLIIVACLIGYDQNDPSFNMASTEEVHNYLGIFGATVANMVFVSFGIALPIFSLAFFFWGYAILRKQPLWEGKYRATSFIFGVIFLSTIFGILDYNPIEGVRFSGSFGKFLSEKLMEFIASFAKFAHVKAVTVAILSLITLFFFNFACGITHRHWFNLAKKIWRGICLCAGYIKKLFGKGEKSEVKLKAKKAKKTMERKEPVFGEVEETPEEEPQIDISVASTPVKAKPQIKKTLAKTQSKKPTAEDDFYQYPSFELLSKPKKKEGQEYSEKELNDIAHKLEEVLEEFGIHGNIVKVRPGPVVTLFELEPAAGTKTARVIGLEYDIARSMSAVSVRIAVVPGSSTIGIELPNKKRENVMLRELLEDDEFLHSDNKLNVVLGKDIGGKNVYADLAKMPHLLVAGTTGSGKSVGVNSMILSLLYKMKPEECRLIMIDPKMLEFSMYNGIPHLLTPVVTDPKKAVVALKWAVHEMEERNRAMAEMNVRNITGYNQKVREIAASGKPAIKKIQVGFDSETGRPIYEEQKMDLTPLPYIVVVVDEMADLMLVAGKEVEAAIQRLAQMARAAGIHLIMATQRPSVDVITGTIKANFPTRISFQVTSKIDSRTILGEQGAEKLLGKGDMLYMPTGIRPIRVHGSFVADGEVEAVVNFLKEQREPEYVEAVTQGELDAKGSGNLFPDDSESGGDDDLYNQAVEIVRKDKKVSISYVQRRLKIGYNRAATIVEKMEENGVITPPDHSGKREVL